MRKVVFILSSAFLALILIVPACQTAPESRRSQLIILDQASELSMGDGAYREFLSESVVSRNDRLVSMARKVGLRIAAVTGAKGYEWEFNLIEDESPNAFCLPGGKVAINSGILPIARNEAGLATVIGHEAAHALARHGAERMSHSLVLAIAGELLAQGLGANDSLRAQIRMAYGVGTTVAVSLPFSRSHELEADHLGLIYMARAGYDPREAGAFWKRFAKYAEQRGGKGLEFLSTHPSDKTRLKQIERRIGKAMAEYDHSPRYGSGQNLL